MLLQILKIYIPHEVKVLPGYHQRFYLVLLLPYTDPKALLIPAGLPDNMIRMLQLSGVSIALRSPDLSVSFATCRKKEEDHMI